MFGILVQIEIDSEGNWWRAKQFPHVAREDKCAVPFSNFFEQPTTLWLTKVVSTILTKCHLSGPGMSTANVEQKTSDSVPGQCVYQSATEQGRVKFDSDKKGFAQKVVPHLPQSDIAVTWQKC